MTHPIEQAVRELRDFYRDSKNVRFNGTGIADRLDAILAHPSTEPAKVTGLEWTDQAPTEPGWYWTENSSVGRFICFHDGVGAYSFGNVRHHICPPDKRFAGPIPTPVEPDAGRIGGTE